MAGVPSEDKTVQEDRQYLKEAKSKGKLSTLKAWVRLSGPGWLQSAITLGGGSLASSLYIGILGGLAILWVQPLAMIFGVIMLSAISYVTLSSGKKPFKAINQEINPVLGWGWIIATIMANIVWSLPQFSLATAALRQNLFPQSLGTGMPETSAKLMVCVPIMVVCVALAWAYGAGVKGAKIFDWIIKAMVALIMISFIGVVIRLAVAEEGIDFASVLAGYVPKFDMLWSPADSLQGYIKDVPAKFQGFWRQMIVDQQRDVIIAAVAVAVGINMTFLRPYSMLKRGWDKTFRGLAIFDLSTGLFIPFLLATSCVVIASASQFHAEPSPGLLGETDAQGKKLEPAKDVVNKYEKIAASRVKEEIGADAFENLSEKEKQERIDNLPKADKRMAAVLVKRDAFDLAESLTPLTGHFFAHYIFGIGVVGVAISSIIILMLINGFAVCELFDRPWGGWTYRLGCLAPALGFLGPFVWTGKAQFWLAVPTSVFGMVLLPVAYFSFFLLMNEKKVLGEDMPRGGKRLLWNVLMALAAGMAAFASFWSLWSKAGWYGVGVIVVFVGLAVTVHFVRKGREQQESAGEASA